MKLVDLERYYFAIVLGNNVEVELWNKVAIRRKEDVGCYYSILLNENGKLVEKV